MIEQLGEVPLQIMLLAQEAAQSLGDARIGTEHILLGVLSIDNPAKSALQGFDVTYDLVRAELEEIRSGQNALPFDVELFVLTERAERVLELAYLEAQNYRHEQVGAEHLLLAMVRLGHGVAAGILTKLGCSLLDLEIALLYQCSSIIAAPLEDVQKELLTQIAVWSRLGVIAREQGYEDLAYQSTQHTKMYKEALQELQATMPAPGAANSLGSADTEVQADKTQSIGGS